MPEKRNRINAFNVVALIVVSAFINIMQALFTLVPFAGSFISMLLGLVADFILWIWFLVLGVHFGGKPSRLFVNLTTRGAELIPLLNALPWLTLGTIILILQARKEDKEYNEKKMKEYEASIAQKSRFSRVQSTAPNQNKR